MAVGECGLKANAHLVRGSDRKYSKPPLPSASGYNPPHTPPEVSPWHCPT